MQRGVREGVGRLQLFLLSACAYRHGVFPDRLSGRIICLAGEPLPCLSYGLHCSDNTLPFETVCMCAHFTMRNSSEVLVAAKALVQGEHVPCKGPVAR